LKKACNVIKFQRKGKKTERKVIWEENQYDNACKEIIDQEEKNQSLGKIEIRVLENNTKVKKGFELRKKFKWKGSRWRYKMKQEDEMMVPKGGTYEEKKEKREIQEATRISQESHEEIINRKKKKDWKKFREKEFNYLISLETVRKKINLWLVRI
jgi:CRISPR/Cas system CMR subunit Cmr4 (Cas7 group RAMP superfamily)